MTDRADGDRGAQGEPDGARGAGSAALPDMPVHPLLSTHDAPPLIETSVAKVIAVPAEEAFAHFFGSQPELRLDLHKDHVKSYHIIHETDDTLEYEYVFEAYGARNWGKAVEVAQRPRRIDVEVTDGPLSGQTITTLFEPVEGGTRVTQVNRVWPGRNDLMVRLMGKTLRSRLVALAGVHLEQHRADLEGDERFQDRFSREHQRRLADEKRGPVGDLLLTTRAITLPIILLPLLGAAALASRQGLFDATALVLSLVGGGAALLAANVLNDLWDFRGGADQATRTVPGSIETGSGAFVEGRWSLRRGWTVTAVLALVALGCGTALAWISTPWVLAYAAAGAAIAYFYIGPPWPLAYKGRGLGELVIFTAFGVVPVYGGVLAHDAAFVPMTGWTAAVFGLTGTLVLYHHHFLHWEADRVAGKRSPVALLGPYRGAFVGALLALATCGFLLAGVVDGHLPRWTALAAVGPLLVLPPAAKVAVGDDGAPARTRLATAAFLAMLVTGIVVVVTLWIT